MRKFELSQPTDCLPLSGSNILVADDSIALRGFLSAALRTACFSITTAVDGLDAYKKARDALFDLIITDHNMPHMNGVELITCLRALPQYHTIPMLVLTIETNDEVKQMARASGATGWIVKPIHPDVIVSVVQKLLMPMSSQS
jgi:two-component system chemotaxis response regulator CheY